MKAQSDFESLRKRLKDLRAPYVKAIIMFGSMARGESKEHSDLDLLVLHEGCEIEDPVARRRALYYILREALGAEFEDITLVEMKLADFVSPSEVTALLLNIYWDAVLVFDKTQTLNTFLDEIRRRIVESGLKRIRDQRAYSWELPEPMKEVKLL
jgi:hypothetical protein